MNNGLSLILFEKEIVEYKTFYRRYLKNIINRQDALAKLFPLCIKFQTTKPISTLIFSKEILNLESQATGIIKQYFNLNILALYNKDIALSSPNKSVDFDKSFLEGLFTALSFTIENLNDKQQKAWKYKTNFLIFLNNCLNDYGLHPFIKYRNSVTYKRYNFRLEHFYKSEKVIIEYKLLLKLDRLQGDFLNPYEKKIPIKINGKLIPFEDIYSINISSTLLLDDEIELLALKENFFWSVTSKEESKFITFCIDETDNLQRNPYLLNHNNSNKNRQTYFVNPIRIEELIFIKSNKFDLTKLIRLCEELNISSEAKINFSTSSLIRNLIDHIPPIFEFDNFSNFANNYSGGSKSFKKSMQNLNISLRNIADNNIHSQIRAKEVLPTTTQVDFAQDIDLLLSEVVRVLK